MFKLSEKIVTSANSSLSYDEENQKSQLAKYRDEQLINVLNCFKEAFKTKDIETIIEVDKAYCMAVVNGSKNLNKDAKASYLSSIARAEQAQDIVNSKCGDYSIYKIVIESTPIDSFDSRGLPKDPVRVYINSQRATIRNQNVNGYMDTSNPLVVQINQQRRNNLDLIEKLYKETQFSYMKKYVTELNFNKAKPIVNKFIKANCMKLPDINQTPDQTQNNSVQFKSPKNDLEH